jgi:membrane protein YqaA with SNARE-associated domain
MIGDDDEAMGKSLVGAVFRPLRSMKEWVEGLAAKPFAPWALFAVAFAESSFFPIPPDVLLIAMAVVMPKRSFRYGWICSAGSVAGGMFGYLVGLEFYDLIGKPIIQFYGVEHQYREVQGLYEKNAFLSIAIAGFTPIPYKVFTIAAGAFQIPFLTLVSASLLSRSARFFLVAALFYRFGAPIKSLIDKYFEWLSIAFVVLLILGFVVIRHFM